MTTILILDDRWLLQEHLGEPCLANNQGRLADLRDSARQDLASAHRWQNTIVEWCERHAAFQATDDAAFQLQYAAAHKAAAALDRVLGEAANRVDEDQREDDTGADGFWRAVVFAGVMEVANCALRLGGGDVDDRASVLASIAQRAGLRVGFRLVRPGSLYSIRVVVEGWLLDVSNERGPVAVVRAESVQP